MAIRVVPERGDLRAITPRMTAPKVVALRRPMSGARALVHVDCMSGHLPSPQAGVRESGGIPAPRVGSGCPGMRGQPRDSKPAPYAKPAGQASPPENAYPARLCVLGGPLFRQRRARSGYARLCATSRGRRHGMAEHDLHQHVEISNGDRTVAAAEVTTSPGPEGTARASLRAESGHITPGLSLIHI